MATFDWYSVGVMLLGLSVPVIVGAVAWALALHHQNNRNPGASN